MDVFIYNSSVRRSRKQGEKGGRGIHNFFFKSGCFFFSLLLPIFVLCYYN